MVVTVHHIVGKMAGQDMCRKLVNYSLFALHIRLFSKHVCLYVRKHLVTMPVMLYCQSEIKRKSLWSYYLLFSIFGKGLFYK